MGGGAMEINTVPCFQSQDAQGIVYPKLLKLQFPVDEQGRTLLVQDVTYYSKAAPCPPKGLEVGYVPIVIHQEAAGAGPRL